MMAMQIMQRHRNQIIQHSLIGKTAPTLSSVSIASNNSTTTQAVADDVVTLTFTASETIATPVVTFNSGGAAITDTSVTYAIQVETPGQRPTQQMQVIQKVRSATALPLVIQPGMQVRL